MSDTVSKMLDNAQADTWADVQDDYVFDSDMASPLDITALCPQTVETVDADEIVAGLEDNDPMDVGEAKEYLNEQIDSSTISFGAVIKSVEDHRDLYVSASAYAGDDPAAHFDTPDGWRAFNDDIGVAFVRDDEYIVEEAADDFVEDKFGDDIIVAAHNTSVAESCMKQLPDCNHSQVDGTHYAWVEEGNDAAERLERDRVTQPAEDRGLTREELEDNQIPPTPKAAVKAIEESDHIGAAHVTDTGHEDEQPYTVSDGEHIPCGWERDPRADIESYLRFSP